MCGRFTQRFTWAEVHAFLSLRPPPLNLKPRYNAAPVQRVAVVRPEGEGPSHRVPAHQCESGNRAHEAGVSCGVPVAALPGAGRRIL